MALSVWIRPLGRHFLLRIRAPHHLNFQGPQAKFEGSLHWNTLTILQFGGVHWALRQNFTRAPLDFRGQGPYLWAPESPVNDVVFNLTHVLAALLHGCLSNFKMITKSRISRLQVLPDIEIGPGPRLNIKTIFPRYGDSHVKDKTDGETVLSLTWESIYW